jgi:hypothetical protein
LHRFATQPPEQHSPFEEHPWPADEQQVPLEQTVPGQQLGVPASGLVHLDWGSPQLGSQNPLLQLPEQQSEKTTHRSPLGLHDRHAPRTQLSPGQHPLPQLCPSPGHAAQTPLLHCRLQQSEKEVQAFPPGAHPAH